MPSGPTISTTALAILLALATSCKEAPDTPQPDTADPQAPQPTAAEAHAIANATITLAHQTLTFPTPRAIIDRDGARILLTSGDEDDEHAFYFEIPVEEELEDGVIEWEQRLTTRELADSPIGIRTPTATLQPLTTNITLRPLHPGVLHVEISGRFLQFANGELRPSKEIDVEAAFDAIASEATTEPSPAK